jgi:hypothetical protein
VEVMCSNPPSGYIACRSRPLQTAVDVVLVEVDGSVSRRSVFTNRAGRFRLKVAPNRYYVFEPRPPVLGMPTEAVEITIPPEGTTITLRFTGQTALDGGLVGRGGATGRSNHCPANVRIETSFRSLQPAFLPPMTPSRPMTENID